LAVLAVVCAAAISIHYVRPLFRTDRALRDSELSPNRTSEILPPPRAPLRTAQDIAALKREELGLAETLMRDFPGNADSLIIMGNVWYRYGDAVTALKYYEKALEINPRRADVYDVMGQCALEKGLFGEAIGHWRTALSLNPRLPNVHSNIGHALMISGKSDEAVEELEKEIQISPTSSLAYFLLGQAHKMQKEYEKAKESYEGAIRVDPEYANAYYGLANVCTKLGKSDEAESYSETFKRLKAEARKDLKDRKVVYDDIVETQKLAALTYVEVGRMYLGNGQLQKAEGFLREAVALDRENAVCLEELAALYQAEGNPAKALVIYKQYRDLYKVIQQRN